MCAYMGYIRLATLESWLRILPACSTESYLDVALRHQIMPKGKMGGATLIIRCASLLTRMKDRSTGYQIAVPYQRASENMQVYLTRNTPIPEKVLSLITSCLSRPHSVVWGAEEG